MTRLWPFSLVVLVACAQTPVDAGADAETGFGPEVSRIAAKGPAPQGRLNRLGVERGGEGGAAVVGGTGGDAGGPDGGGSDGVGGDGAGGEGGEAGDAGSGGSGSGDAGSGGSGSGGAGSGGSDSGGQGPGGSSSGGESGGEAATCVGYAPEASEATHIGAPAFPGFDQLYFTASTQGETYEVLSLELYFDFGASTELGDYQPYTFSGTGYAGCVVCLVKHTGCVSNDGEVSCEKTFLADGGEMFLDDLGRGGSTLAGSLDGVQFRQVQIDPATSQSTPVLNGERICIEGYEFSQAVIEVQ